MKSVKTQKPLSVTTSMPSLFNYSDYATQASPYPSARIKLSPIQLKKWMAKEVQPAEGLDDSPHNAIVDDEEPDSGHPRGQLTTPAQTGTKAMLDFFTKYKNMYKNPSPMNVKAPSASYTYLRKIDKLKRVPHPMGIVKWKGQANELNLQYRPLRYPS
jgi:hypothetical protein